MITNEKQCKITCSQFKKMLEAKNELEPQLTQNKNNEQQLIKIQFEAIKSECEVLKQQIQEYDLLKSGEISKFTAKTFEELPLILIKARIAKGLSQGELAKLLSLKEQQIQRYESDLYSSVNLKRLSKIAEVLELEIDEIAEFRQKDDEDKLPWNKFPIKEMYKRNWFFDFKESLDSALANGEYLIDEFLKSASTEPIKAFNRTHSRINSTLDQYSLYAWQCRITWLAKNEKIQNKFTKKAITKNWLKGLVELSAAEDGPQQAKKYLASTGIHLIIEPHLPHTLLDGAALLLPDKTPVIGMTLRYNRLDNFWFVLFHEIAHLHLHLFKLEINCFFDDLESETKNEKIEIEADEFTNEALIPNEIWETSIVRYVHSKSDIIDFAKQLNISAAIVAGRIRKETNNYTIYNDLIGQGDVRKNFPEVIFN